VVHKFLGLGGQALLVSDGTNWQYFGSDYQVLCSPAYSTGIGDLLSADASGNTHYFGQTTSTQATSLTVFSSSSCTLPANILGTNTILQANWDGYVQTASSSSNVVIGLKLGSTPLTSTTTSSTLNANLAAQSMSFFFRIYGTGAPSSSTIVDASCDGARGMSTGACLNTTIPNNTLATNTALSLTANGLFSTNTAGNAFWLREWQVVMLSGPTN
jgi:hypothetical protein